MMNLNQILNIIIRTVIVQLTRTATRTAMGMLNRRPQAARNILPDSPQAALPSGPSAAASAAPPGAQSAQEMELAAKRVRQAAAIARRSAR